MWPRFCLWLMLPLSFVAIAVAQDTSSPDPLQSVLLAEETGLIEAINRKDKAAITELLADESMSITSRGRQTTADVVRSLEDISFSGYKITDPTTIVIGPDAAILTYTFSWTGGDSGQPSATTNVYATSVWRKRDGQWRSVFYQETPIDE